jgi:hypothetical protein
MSETAIKNRSRLLENLLLYSPVLIAILIMLPRLLSPQFGLFDDGRSLVTARTISSGTWYTGMDTIEGRFRPLHWLWFTSLYLINGADPFWFFAGNMLALAFVTGGIIFLVRKADGRRLQAWLAGMAFVLAGPIAETYFSLKAEAHQSIFLMLALLSILPHAKAHTRLQTAGAFILTTLAALCACYSKETSILLLPISITWYLLARFWPGYEKDAVRQKMRGAFVVANLVAVSIFFVTRAWAASSQINVGTYTMRYALIFSQIIQSSIRWGGWMTRDFIWVAPLAFVFIVLLLMRRKLMGGVLLFDAFIWMAAWVVIYLPWNFMAEYYMLPFAMGLAVFVSALVIEIVPALREQGWKRWLSIAGLGLTLILLVGSLFNTLTNARVQLAVDSGNASMMAHLVQTAAPNSTIVVNFQDFTEYVSEMQTQFESVYNRPDLKLKMFNPSEPLPESAGDIYLVTAKVQNQPLLTVRMGVIEESQDIWNKILQGFLQENPNWHSVFETTRSFRLSDVNYPRLFCPFIETRAFCATTAPFFDIRPFLYGWTIYKLEKP